MSRRRQTWLLKTPNEAFKLCDRGFGHVGVRRTKVSFDTDIHRKPIGDGRKMPAASLVRRCWHLVTLQTTCSVFGARGLQAFMATGSPCAPGKIASSSYRMKARDLTSGLPALPVGLSEILQTAENPGFGRVRMSEAPGPAGVSSHSHPKPGTGRHWD